jgi:hypothetical protein
MDSRTPEITNSSALQLYHSAYRCHYELNDLAEACRLYREIIRQFPQSNECAYAVVQLEKIGANEVLKNLNIAPANKILPLAALIISVLALFIAGAALLLMLEKVQHSWYTITAPHYCSAAAEMRDIDTINAEYPAQYSL